MSTLILPQIGKSPQNATVLRWRKRVGDAVGKGDVLLEVETDEGLAEIEAVGAGRLHEILAPAGRTLAVGTPLAVVGEGIAANEASGSVSKTSAAVSPKSPIPNPRSEILITMSTRSSPQPVGPVTPVLMPKAGQSMEEGTIVKWHVQPGAIIKKGDVIFEIETDKATMEVEAVDAGRLARIVVADGGVSPVLQPVGYLAENDADVDAFLAGGGPGEAVGARPAENSGQSSVVSSQAQPAKALGGGSVPQTSAGRVKASPAARKVAAERGVDLAFVGAGSGPGGRILSTDVPVAASAKPSFSGPTSSVPASVASLPGPGAEVVRKRMSGMRKAIARNLTLSKTTIPHWYISARINAGPLLSFYKSQKAKYPCSVNDVITLACAKAIMEFPALHSRVDGETILEFPGANIGIAVGMDDGLVVPVVLHAEKYTLEQLAGETKRLANQARAGKIENMGQGIFTISNLGMFGVDEFIAIVNPPEAAILAVSTAREDVLVKDGAIKAGHTMNLTLSADHRLIDGTLGAQFMARLRALLENPVQLIA